MSLADLIRATNATYGAATTVDLTLAQNTQPMADGIAERKARDKGASLLGALAAACRGLDTTPFETKQLLTQEDIDAFHAGEVAPEVLAAFANALVQQRDIEQGKVPEGYTEPATCRHCGPIWLWTSSNVLSCPWCANRLADRPIPRPRAVRCIKCQHFNRIDHPRLGHCAKGEPEAVAGLWDTTARYCERYLPANPSHCVGSCSNQR